MRIGRRRFLYSVAGGAASLLLPACERRDADKYADALYDIPPFGNLSLLHLSDSHGQLSPLYLRESAWRVNADGGVVNADTALKDIPLRSDGAMAYALSAADFVGNARRHGKVGGYAYLATLIKSLRDQRPGRSLLLDGGSSWQGSALALWSEGEDMLGASKLLGVDAMTAHGEFALGADALKHLVESELKGTAFLAANVHDEVWGTGPFKGSTVREVNGIRVGIVGLAYPHMRAAHPKSLCPDWHFDWQEAQVQKRVDDLRAQKCQVVVLLSHAGLNADLKLAGRVTGIDVVLSGHSHDPLPIPASINNAGGRTLVVSSGAHGKFLSVLDLKIGHGKLRDFRYKLVPVITDLIAPDARMAAYIENRRAPFKAQLEEPLATTQSLLYRRDPFGGSMDQLITDAMLATQEVDIALSPGYRSGESVLPGGTITTEIVYSHTAITYPACDVTERTGEEIKNMLEHFADAAFNKDPYLQHGYDMVRAGGLRYRLDIGREAGQRISELALRDGKALNAEKVYRVASWGLGEPRDGRPIWEVVAEYLRAQREIKIDTFSARPVTKR